MTLFRLDASIRTQGSASRELADAVETQWVAAHPDARIERRELGIDPLPSHLWADAVTAGFVPAEQRTAEQEAALKVATGLADELVEADVVLLAIPLYNYGVSQHVKAWIDLISTDPRTKDRDRKLLEGKPVVLATVRGGTYQPGTPRDGWDHSTAYVQRIVADVWGADLTVVEREYTLVGVNPALDQFTEVAAELRTDALAAAAHAGRSLAA